MNWFSSMFFLSHSHRILKSVREREREREREPKRDKHPPTHRLPSHTYTHTHTHTTRGQTRFLFVCPLERRPWVGPFLSSPSLPLHHLFQTSVKRYFSYVSPKHLRFLSYIFYLFFWAVYHPWRRSKYKLFLLRRERFVCYDSSAVICLFIF